MPLVNDILTYVHQRDERFKIQPLHVGSYYSHLKVSRADEFDYSVVLDTPSFVWTSGTPAYYGFDENKQSVVNKSVSFPSPPVGKYFTQVSGIIEKWDQQRLNEGQSCLTVGNHLIPIKVKRRFKQLVGEAVNRPQIRQFVDVKRLSESPAATLSISHPDIAGDCVSVDLAPLVEAHLPFKPEFGWPRSNARWYIIIWKIWLNVVYFGLHLSTFVKVFRGSISRTMNVIKCMSFNAFCINNLGGI